MNPVTGDSICSLDRKSFIVPNRRKRTIEFFRKIPKIALLSLSTNIFGTIGRKGEEASGVASGTTSGPPSPWLYKLEWRGQGLLTGLLLYAQSRDHIPPSLLTTETVCIVCHVPRTEFTSLDKWRATFVPLCTEFKYLIIFHSVDDEREFCLTCPDSM